MLETNGYYALGLPLYLGLALAEIALLRRRKRLAYRFADTVGNLSAGLGEVVIGLFLGPLLIALYQWTYRRYALFHFRDGSPWPWLLAFVAGDLCYYWYHRACSACRRRTSSSPSR